MVIIAIIISLFFCFLEEGGKGFISSFAKTVCLCVCVRSRHWENNDSEDGRTDIIGCCLFCQLVGEPAVAVGKKTKIEENRDSFFSYFLPSFLPNVICLDHYNLMSNNTIIDVESDARLFDLFLTNFIA